MLPQTSNWNDLGRQFYRKSELCQMLWPSTLVFEDYLIALAPFGGPIALMTNENVSKRLNKTNISIYSAMGEVISSFSVQENILQIGWTHQEELVCIHKNGLGSMYSMFGQYITTLKFDQEIRDSKIIDCKIFKSVYGTGIAILTASLSFYLYNNIYELKIRRLAEIPYLKSPPICWDVITYDKDTKLIISKENTELVILKSQDLSCTIINPFNENSQENVIMMNVSFDYSHIALFTETGKILLSKTENDISYCYSVFDTESKIRPKQMAWCENDALACHWSNIILLIDLNQKCLNYPTFNNVYMIQEIDCIRVIDHQCQEMIKKVEQSAVDVLKIGSFSSGANLLEASRLFELENHKVDDYIRLIQEKNEMEIAVNMCLDAASHEFNIPTQKMLLRAVLFGKCFTNKLDPSSYYKVCQRLRILNAIRKTDVGMPMTYYQLDLFTIPRLIDRLIERKHFLLALKIANFLKIPRPEGEIRVLTNWAFYKVRQQENDEINLANAIHDKLRLYSGVSYAVIANKAVELGRKSLAIKLLEHELKPTDQVPLLLKLKQFHISLKRSIESGDTNLIYHVLLHLKKKQSPEEFLMSIRKYPIAFALYQKFCKQDDKEYLRNIYFQEDDFHSEGVFYLEQSSNVDTSDISWRKNKISYVVSALDMFKKARNDFLTTHTDEYLRLLKHQFKLEEKFPSIKFYGISLQDTLKLLIQNNETKLCEDLKKEFKMPDKRYYHLKLMTLAEMNDWMEIEKLAKAKKSPIGYEPFVDVCLQYNNRYEAQKYLAKVRDENKIKYLVKMGNMEEAAKFAFERKDVDALFFIETKCVKAKNPFHEKVRVMINKFQ